MLICLLTLHIDETCFPSLSQYTTVMNLSKCLPVSKAVPGELVRLQRCPDLITNMHIRTVTCFDIPITKVNNKFKRVKHLAAWEQEVGMQ